MKALTLTQPWASLVAVGAKRIETRSWATHYRGPLAIHAAKGWTARDREFAASPLVSAAMCGDPEGVGLGRTFPLGYVVATVELLDCVPIAALRSHLRARDFEPAPCEERFGDYRPDRWAWLLGDVRQLVQPKPVRGRQRLWNLPDEMDGSFLHEPRWGFAESPRPVTFEWPPRRLNTVDYFDGHDRMPTGCEVA